MKKLIQAIIGKWFCKHKWEVISIDTFHEFEDSLPYKSIKTIVCTECGKRVQETFI